MTALTGAINCARSCEIPDGISLIDMPPTRHAWSDMARCPWEDCGRFFMIQRPKEEAPSGDRT